MSKKIEKQLGELQETVSSGFQMMGDKFDSVDEDIKSIRSELQEVKSNQRTMLTHMDNFAKGLEDETHERLAGDHLLEQRIVKLEKA